jgi:hypothetical protein
MKYIKIWMFRCFYSTKRESGESFPQGVKKYVEKEKFNKSLKVFLCTFLSPAREKYQKRRRSRGNLRFPLKIPSLDDARTRHSRVLSRPTHTYIRSAELSTAVDQLGRAEQAR